MVREQNNYLLFSLIEQKGAPVKVRLFCFFEVVSNYFEAVFFIRNLYQNSVLVLRDEYKTERTYVREYLCDSVSDKNVFATISFNLFSFFQILFGVFH